MHREISHTDETFQRESNASLYLLTGLIGALMALDLWPVIAAWLASAGIVVWSWPREISGYRLAYVPAIVGGLRVVYNSLDRLLEGRIGADLAIAVACVAAIFVREPVVAAEIVFIGMLGECLESYTFERAQRAIRRVVEIFPRRSWLLRDGQEVRVLSTELQVGDSVVVKPGGRVPVDGVILSGQSTLDQSALTGESLPVERQPGQEVFAGCVNQLGTIVIEARRVAEHTVAGQVIELTSRAIKDKALSQRTADRLARYFLPVVLGLAAITFLANLLIRSKISSSQDALALADSVYPALSVLVVACPCALILATPATVLAALGRLAGSGVLVKGGSALERLATVRAFAFDKTGTLTEGRFEVGDILVLGDATADAVLRAAATAEQQSEHVIAQAITQAAVGRGLSLAAVSEFLAHPGAGVRAKAGDEEILAGSSRVLQEYQVELPQQAASISAKLDADSQTILWVACNRHILGAIGIRDRIRPEAAGVLDELRSLGIEMIYVLTGDREAAAKAVANQLPMTEMHAELLPAEKAKLIERYQAERPVAMVGDGINDAPALARATVGLAVGATATDLAAEAGDFVLMGEPLKPLPLLLKLSRQTVRIIRQNILIFAFGVNAVGIAVTAWLWPVFAPVAWHKHGPLAAVIYHQVGSLAVLLNAMRLLWFERGSRAQARRPLASKLELLDVWLTHRLDMHSLGHWLSDHRRGVLTFLSLLAVSLYALSGWAQIEADEQAVVTRFGKPVADLEPGLYWRWPWPMERVLRVRPARVDTVEFGFRSAAATTVSLAWDSSHAPGGSDSLDEEMVLITGDGNLVEIQATLRYTIGDPRSYLSGALDHQATLRAVTESALREAVASQRFAELLALDREMFQREIEERINTISGHFTGLGIKLDGLSIHDLHPPKDVVPAYHDVTRAMETRDRRVNEAQADALKRITSARSEANQLVRRAEAAKTQTVKLAESERDSFFARCLARNQPANDDPGRKSSAAKDSASESRRIQIQMALTDFRLFWDALARGLVGREKILIDAEQLPGHRQLLLFDPEKLWLPPGVLNAPANRGQKERSSSETEKR